MVNLRPGFRDIASGWMLVDDHDELDDRLERLAEFAKDNPPLTDDERATFRFMLQTHVARARRDGRLDSRIPRGEAMPENPEPAAPAILIAIKALVEKFLVAFPGQAPTGLFVPASRAGDVQRLCIDVIKITQPRADVEGLVIAQLLGLHVRLCTGSRLGVGIVRADDGAVPHHMAVFE